MAAVGGQVRELEVCGLFFAIGHEPATKFLGDQVALTDEKYIVTQPGETTTSVPGVFAAGDVQDKKWRQAITAAGSGSPPPPHPHTHTHSRSLPTPLFSSC